MNHPNWINEQLAQTNRLLRRRRLAILAGLLALVLIIGLLAGCSTDSPEVAVSGVTDFTEESSDYSRDSAPTTHTTSTTVPPSSTTTQATVPATVATTLPPTTTTLPVETAAASEPVVMEPQPEPGSIKAMIYEVFPGEGAYATSVFKCESKLNPNAVSPTNDHGVAQINEPTWNHPGHADPVADYIGSNWGSVYDPYTNLLMARKIRDKYGWDSWACA